jgi:ABC-type polysaccharide/polyol phosphate export permease
MLGLIYHSIVREIRKDHRNAVVGLIMNMMQTVIFVTAFYFMFTILGLKGTAIRGDFMLYIMSGIFLFLTHTKAMGAVLKAEGPASALMKHAPMNTIIAISSAAIASLYIQPLSIAVVLYLYHVILSPITIHDPTGAIGMVLPAWFSGCCSRDYLLVTQTMVSRIYLNPAVDLCPCQYDRLGQDVCGQHDARFHAHHV